MSALDLPVYANMKLKKNWLVSFSCMYRFVFQYGAYWTVKQVISASETACSESLNGTYLNSLTIRLLYWTAVAAILNIKMLTPNRQSRLKCFSSFAVQIGCRLGQRRSGLCRDKVADKISARDMETFGKHDITVKTNMGGLMADFG